MSGASIKAWNFIGISSGGALAYEAEIKVYRR
jgi:hypothetical protein